MCKARRGFAVVCTVVVSDLDAVAPQSAFGGRRLATKSAPMPNWPPATGQDIGCVGRRGWRTLVIGDGHITETLGGGHDETGTSSLAVRPPCWFVQLEFSIVEVLACEPLAPQEETSLSRTM